MKQAMAIVERLPGHTEDMGGFAALALELGYDTHLFFEEDDPFHLMDYYRTRLPIQADHLHNWSKIIELSEGFKVILLNTSFVWLDYGPVLQEWNGNKRLVVVHHHPEDVELNPFGKSLYLTPAQGTERWIFPLYSKPVVRREADKENSSLPPQDAGELPTLICIGTFEGKDVAGAGDYMKAGGRLVHYDRHRCGHFTPGDGRYAQHRGLDGVQLMTSLAQQQQPVFLWFPIISPSDYMVCRFTAALIVGVEMNCVMVMPERLRGLYGFPKEAVIAYDKSVTEADCLESLRDSPWKQQDRQRRLAWWAAERWEENLTVFRTLLGLRD